MADLDALDVSWPLLRRRLDTSRAWPRWVAAEPVLARVAGLDELIATSHRCQRGPGDEVLGALLRLASTEGGNDVDAASLVALLLRPGARALAMSVPDLSGDVGGLVAAELWVAIRTVNTARRGRGYARGVLLDTRAAVLAELLPYRARSGASRLVLLDPTDPVAAARLDRSLRQSEDERLVRVGELLTWGRRQGVLRAGDVAVLQALLAAGHEARGRARASRGFSCAAEEDLVAARCGVSRQTVRRRRDRALTVLRRASAQYLAEAA